MSSLRQLQWDELDLLQGLEATPTPGENGSYRYRVQQQDLQLRVSLWPEHGMVDVTLFSTASRAILLDLTVAVRGRIRYNNDKRGEYLEFADCLLVSRLLASDEQLEAAFSPNTPGRPMVLTVKPTLSVLFE
ncbi:hypothetical protein [Hymenobacter guriensis]|uniref:Uncharacterized protein n=1 Tax=Hymenobacter guriensis TaxID=2793065 RepID=A0ABS0KYT5_9BACT|nr:hypothetical protein [Hymenobacter guriensis]MBG8552900.1 hypothetical protein [Hymenobacter guriensis]